MSVTFLIVALLPALLAAAAISDLLTYKIPNALTGGLILLFVAFLIVRALNGYAMSWSDWSPHLLAGLIGLIAGMGFFALGWIGGGDAKFFAGALLWLGWDSLLEYALVASLLGGALTVAIVLLRHQTWPAFLLSQAWFARLSDKKAGVPYGVALALGALLVLPYTHVFEIAAAG